MPASYPSTVKTFTAKVDFVDTVLAEHVNSLQDEVTSVQANLGTNVKTGSGWIGSFDQATTNWNTLKDRLANIEYGLYSAFNSRVSTAGGSTISSATATTVGLTVQTASGQTANQVEFKALGGTVVSRVGADAYIYTSSQRLVPVVYSSTVPSGVPAGTIWVDSTSSVAPFTSVSGVPAGGSTSQVLQKTSSADYDVSWGTIYQVPSGGSTDQVLKKNSGTNYDTSWTTIYQVPSGGSTDQVLKKNSASNYDISWADAPTPMNPFLLAGM